jgi:hypothetical protein
MLPQRAGERASPAVMSVGKGAVEPHVDEGLCDFRF